MPGLRRTGLDRLAPGRTSAAERRSAKTETRNLERFQEELRDFPFRKREQTKTFRRHGNQACLFAYSAHSEGMIGDAASVLDPQDHSNAGTCPHIGRTLLYLHRTLH